MGPPVLMPNPCQFPAASCWKKEYRKKQKPSVLPFMTVKYV